MKRFSQLFENKFVQRTPEERERLFNDAKNEFGTTLDFREVGYIMPDGSMLDFSEKRDGGQPGQRSADHRNVGEIINDREYETRTDYLNDFINEGPIRVMPETGGIDLAQPPTKKQKDKLMSFIYRYNGEVELEITKDGQSVCYACYKERTSPRRILNDIDSYFSNGIIPEGNV